MVAMNDHLHTSAGLPSLKCLRWWFGCNHW